MKNIQLETQCVLFQPGPFQPSSDLFTKESIPITDSKSAETCKAKIGEDALWSSPGGEFRTDLSRFLSSEVMISMTPGPTVESLTPMPMIFDNTCEKNAMLGRHLEAPVACRI